MCRSLVVANPCMSRECHLFGAWHGRATSDVVRCPLGELRPAVCRKPLYVAGVTPVDVAICPPRISINWALLHQQRSYRSPPFWRGPPVCSLMRKQLHGTLRPQGSHHVSDGILAVRLRPMQLVIPNVPFVRSFAHWCATSDVVRCPLGEAPPSGVQETPVCRWVYTRSRRHLPAQG